MPKKEEAGRSALGYLVRVRVYTRLNPTADHMTASSSLQARDEAWNFHKAEPKTVPGSAEEEDALLRIDAARAQEERELADTPEDRARRHARHWRRQHRRG